MTSPVAAVEGPARPGRWPVVAWGLWDWGSAAFNAVITTFVFTVYLTSDDFGPGAETKLGWALGAAGLVVALFAPLTGQRADRSGRRNRWLAVNTGIVVLTSAAMFVVTPTPDLLWLGLLLLAAGNVAFEFASVNYNAMLPEISTPATVGRVSGLGWGLGYLGGIVLLLAVYLGLIAPDVGLFGVTSADGLDVRVTMLLCAVWTLVFSLPVLLTLRDHPGPRQERAARLGLVDSYRALFASVGDLWRHDPAVVRFLVASAVFRDGLAGVFTFGGVIAHTVFGFDDGGVIIFGVVANVVAGVATIAAGALDDRLGPKRVILAALVSMVVAGVVIFALHGAGTWVFWSFGLLLAVFVGPAQSASRTYLARMVPEGREGQVFGLYATTGRAVSFLAPVAFSLAIVLGGGADHWGILGIVLVLVVGIALLVPVPPPRPRTAGAGEGFQESPASH